MIIVMSNMDVLSMPTVRPLQMALPRCSKLSAAKLAAIVLLNLGFMASIAAEGTFLIDSIPQP